MSNSMYDLKIKHNNKWVNFSQHLPENVITRFFDVTTKNVYGFVFVFFSTWSNHVLKTKKCAYQTTGIQSLG